MSDHDWATPPQDQPAAPPVCPRHPGEVSYVRCQRCGRPTCPQCQRPAAVGVQCVDCVREQSHTVRTSTTVFGGQVTERPVVSIAIVVVCVLVWLAQRAMPDLTSEIAFVPVLGESQPWRFVSSAFAHDQNSILHIGFNMFALWIVGAQYLEPLLGHLRYAVLYLVSAVGGSVVYLVLSQPPSGPVGTWSDLGSWGVPAVGASGAVFGLFAALLVLNRKLGRSSAGMYATIALNAVIGFVVPGIAWQAHLGGLLTGAAVAAVFTWTAARTRRGWQWPALAGIVVLLTVLTVVKYAVSPHIPVA